MDMHGGEAATSPSLPLGCPRAPPFPIKGGPRQPREGIGQDWAQDRCQDKTSQRKSRTPQVEQVHGFTLGLGVEKRGDLPTAGSARLLPLATTLPGSLVGTSLVARHHDDIYPDMHE